MCPIYSTDHYCSYCHLHMLSIPLPLKTLEVSKTERFLILSHLSVTIVSVFIWIRHHQRYHWKHKRHWRQTVAIYSMELRSFLFPFYFENFTTSTFIKNSSCTEIFLTSCLYFSPLFKFLLEDSIFTDFIKSQRHEKKRFRIPYLIPFVTVLEQP